MLLTGKVALVTGAARGIGRGIALELARAGADVCVNDRTVDRAGAEVVAVIEALGRRALLVQADVSDRPAVERMVAQCTETLGPIDILVASAVISVRQTILDTREEDLRRTIEVSIFGTFHVPTNSCGMASESTSSSQAGRIRLESGRGTRTRSCSAKARGCRSAGWPRPRTLGGRWPSWSQTRPPMCAGLS